MKIVINAQTDVRKTTNSELLEVRRDLLALQDDVALEDPRAIAARQAADG
jgi:hypothetical protein